MDISVLRIKSARQRPNLMVVSACKFTKQGVWVYASVVERLHLLYIIVVLKYFSVYIITVLKYTITIITLQEFSTKSNYLYFISVMLGFKEKIFITILGHGISSIYS